MHAGQMLNGIAGCVVMAAPPFLSNIWFPPHERITATGITTLMNYMGKLYSQKVVRVFHKVRRFWKFVMENE